MAKKTTISTIKFVEAGSATAGFSSDVIDMLGMDKVSAYMEVTGTATGLAALHYSNDGISFIASASTATLASVDAVLELETSLRYVKLVVAAGGTGTVDVHVCGKSLSS